MQPKEENVWYHYQHIFLIYNTNLILIVQFTIQILLTLIVKYKVIIFLKKKVMKLKIETVNVNGSLF